MLPTIHASDAGQLPLFDVPFERPASWPDGLSYVPDWLSRDDECALLDEFRQLPFEHARFRIYTARRKVVRFGDRVDDEDDVAPPRPLPVAIRRLRDRAAAWAGLAPDDVVHALVSEYAPGTPLGWHRDAPDFADVFGVSLGGPAMLRFRPSRRDDPRSGDIVRLVAAPRSLYRMSGPARWQWQHSVAPVAALRWSVTFRTRVSTSASVTASAPGSSPAGPASRRSARGADSAARPGSRS